MEVVLLENIKNLGQIGDVVDVKRGHGRNFLIKYGKALKATTEITQIIYQMSLAAAAVNSFSTAHAKFH